MGFILIGVNIVQSITFKKSDFPAMIPKLWGYVDRLDDSRQYVIEVKEYRKPRSLNANAYMWELLGKLSEAMHIPANDLYRQYVREMGVYRTFEIQADAISTLEHVWSAHGLGWFLDVIDDGANDGFKLVKVYYGSSCYNTKQMAALIDAVVQDCQSLHIETKTPDEIARLVSLWEGQT